MNIKEQVDYIKQFTPVQIASDVKLRRILSELFMSLYPGQELCTYCLGKIESALSKLSQTKNFIVMSTERKSRLKEGQQIRVHGSPKILTNNNMTDNEAVNILKKYPKLASKFETLPDMPEGEVVKKDQERTDEEKLKALKNEFKAVLGTNPHPMMKESTMKEKIAEKRAEEAEKRILDDLRTQFNELSGDEANPEWSKEQLVEKIAEEKEAISKLTEEKED